eukprot:CAMPEP_0117420650 /NCGR_PEP_ID=MMETSP0758-20121206/1934_1 /TAXON_ID=63605 /ORGANISM="Percolomonas cosmopolitus, Strain AE-1 (ATCC 50343)" /LENGTH=53 /DNA_ID=CAMNT_0005202371 /DNA_START=1 /DNA_END=162 /DNA_ORIENTATION=-
MEEFDDKASMETSELKTSPSIYDKSTQGHHFLMKKDVKTIDQYVSLEELMHSN